MDIASCHCRLTSLQSVDCRSVCYQLRQLRHAVRSLSEDASQILVQAFVSCRLDYCNFLFFGISEGLINRLQSLQNATARIRMVTGRPTRLPEHVITPVLRQLRTSAYINFEVSNLRRSFIGRCSAFRHHTYPTTAVSSPMS